MAYRIGIEVGPEQTTWASVNRDAAGHEHVDGGVIKSVVGVVDGEVVVGEDATDPSRVQEVTRGFVQRLGESDAVMLGGTPYGVETLIGRLIAAANRKATQQLGSAPGGVVIVHDDGLDEFRVGLLTEAARLAGVPLANLMMVSRSEALAASLAPAAPAGLETVAGAARLGWTRDRGPITAAVGGVAAADVGIAATGVAAGAGGAAVAATALGEGMASAGAALTPTAGAGPAGSPLPAPSAGPTGSPLTPPAGPAGTPLTPPAGPTGSPLGPVPTPGSSGIPGVLKRPRKIPMIIGASVAAVAVATTVVIATNNDDPSSTSPSTTVASEPVVTVPTTITDSTTNTTVETTIPAVVPNAAVCVQGEWTMRNETFAEFFASNIAASAEGELVATGVSGSITMNVAPDGTWTTTYSAWTISASMPSIGADASIVINGTDVSIGTFTDDGVYGFTGVSVGTTIDYNATVNGMAFPIGIDRTTQVIEGSGSFTCSGDEMILTVDASASGGSFVMDRTG